MNVNITTYYVLIKKMPVLTLDSDNYEATTKSKGVVIVKFSTMRCQKCKKIKSWYDSDLSVNYKEHPYAILETCPPQYAYDKHTYCEADLDDVFEFDEVDSITSMPAFIKYKNGKYITTVCSDDQNTIKDELKLKLAK